jgi:hypothetical protein
MATTIPGMATTVPGIATTFPGMATTVPGAQLKVVTFTPESVGTFDRNRWAPSIGMGGHLGPEYAVGCLCVL